MSAEVESMFTVREPAWHGEGLVLADYPGSWAEARKLAGLEWEPTSADVYTETGVSADGSIHYEPLTDWKAISRSDTGAVLSVNTSSYQVIDHTEMGEIIEAVLDQPNVKYETAGSLSGGRKVWCLVQLDEPITLPHDNSVTMPYAAITNRHDGQGACAVRATAVRIVCANTFAAAEIEGERTGMNYSFVHTSGWRNRLAEAREAITGVRAELKRYEKIATDLLGIKVNARQRELFVREFVPTPPDGLISDRVARNVEEARQAVRDILASKTTVAVADTAYGLVQAAGEYLDHVRRAQTWETRLNRNVLRPEPLKHKAMVLAREVATT